MQFGLPLNVLSIALVSLLSLTASATGHEAAQQDRTAINQQLDRYFHALNASDIETVMAIYAQDAVFMPQHSQPAVGRDAVRQAYRHVFDAIHLDVRFKVDEVVVLSNEWAYARTRSTGTVRPVGSDQPTPEANQEFFLFHHEDDGQWRFARYIFSTMNPPNAN